MTNSFRKSLRLPDFDYAQTGAYFITIVTQNRLSLFGTIENDKMILNDIGKMIDDVCQELPQFVPGVLFEPYVIMPNHFHAIVLLHMGGVGATLCGRPVQVRQTQRSAPTGPIENSIDPISLSDVVGRFKSLTTLRYIHGVRKFSWPRFENRLWQRSYYEHIIRDERDFQSIADYILNNPLNWEKDEDFFKVPNDDIQ
jgi:REP element-mobilizing transposase RayT